MTKNRNCRLIRVSEETFQKLLKRKEELDEKQRSFDKVIKKLEEEAQ